MRCSSKIFKGDFIPRLSPNGRRLLSNSPCRRPWYSHSEQPPPPSPFISCVPVYPIMEQYCLKILFCHMKQLLLQSDLQHSAFSNLSHIVRFSDDALSVLMQDLLDTEEHFVHHRSLLSCRSYITSQNRAAILHLLFFHKVCTMQNQIFFVSSQRLVTFSSRVQT